MQTLNQEKEEADAKVAVSAVAQGDLRAAVLVKDKVLEDREKVHRVCVLVRLRASLACYRLPLMLFV